MSKQSREAAREKRRAARQGSRKQRHIDELDASTLMKALGWLLSRGGALRVGMTRDCGAWAFGIYGDGPESYTEYVGQDEDVNEYLTNLADYCENGWEIVDDGD